MPPHVSSLMTIAEREQFQQLVNAIIADFECGLAPNPGQVTLRRLNANEYRNTFKELLQVDYSPAGSFPSDDVGYGLTTLETY